VNLRGEVRQELFSRHNDIAHPTEKDDTHGFPVPVRALFNIWPAKPNETALSALKESASFSVLDQAIRRKRFERSHDASLLENSVGRF
jgi:hypothetical protein